MWLCMLTWDVQKGDSIYYHLNQGEWKQERATPGNKVKGLGEGWG